MRHSCFLVVFLLVLSLSSVAIAQGTSLKAKDFKEGREYTKISSPLYGKDDGRVEVLSFYWYNCGACFYLEPKIAAWAAKLPPKKVRFIKVPFGYSGPSLFHAKLALALDKMGLGDWAHLKMFELMQTQRLPIYSSENLPQVAKSLIIDEKQLIEAFNSPEVAAQLSKTSNFILAADITGVPSMLINGKYRFDIGTTYGSEGYLDLADILIEREQ